jgi:protease-4
MPENTEQNQSGTKPPMPPYPPQYSRRRKSSNWWIPVIIIVAIIVVIGFVAVAFFGMIGSAFSEKPVQVTNNSVLYLDLNNVQEYRKASPFSSFMGGATGKSMLNQVTAIKRAAKDNNIKGIYIKPGLSSPGLVKAKEINKALDEFKQSGKFIYSFIEVGAESQYYSALPADSIFMPNEGMLEMNGFATVSIFFKDLFERAGVNFYVERFEDYKSAAETYNRTGFSDSARYQIDVILKHRFNDFVKSVSEHRNISEDVVSDVLHRGVYSADTLYNLGFIDAYSTETTLKEFIKNKLLPAESDDEINYISPYDYLKSDPPLQNELHDTDTQIAVIYGSGAITSGEQEGFDSEYQIKSGSLVQYIKEAREDDKIKAIVLRIDSPGGSVIASDEIWQEIQKTRKVKPVYASMSDVAASGGYYMAMACDTIFADESTITGSIGVIMAVPNFSELSSKLDVNVDTITTNPSANFMNALMPFSDTEKEKMHKLVDGMYKRFVTKVAESRGMKFDETRAVAKGRVWLGKDALEVGLVDELGNLSDVINAAKHRIGVPEDKLVMIQTYPKPIDDVKALLKLFGIDSDAGLASNDLSQISDKLKMNPVEMLTTWKSLPPEAREELKYFQTLSEISQNEKYLMAMPQMIRIK